MVKASFTFVVFYYGLVLVKSDKSNVTKATNRFQFHIQNVMNDVTSQHWTEEELPCVNSFLKVLQNAQNHTLWALMVWESIQSPSGFLYGSKYQLGNFDECISTPWLDSHPELKMKQCLTEIKFKEDARGLIQDPYASIEDYIKSKNQVKFNNMAWSVCVPVTCSEASITKFVRSMLQSTYLEFALAQSAITINSCQETKELPFTKAFYGFLFFVGLCLVTTVVAAIYYSRNQNNCKPSLSLDIAKSLSIVENASELTRIRADEIPVFNGLRCLSSFIVVFWHTWYFTDFIGYSNALYLKKAIEKHKIHLIYHTEIVVDTFFVISGFLLLKSFLSSRSFNPVKVIMKRYIRLMYLMSIIIIGGTVSLQYLNDGPLFVEHIKPVGDTCEKNFWLNLLMVNNYVNTDNMCYPITWFIACDFQLTLLCVILYWIYQRNHKKAVYMYVFITSLSVLLPAIETYVRKLPAVLEQSLEEHRTQRVTIINRPTYIYAHLRACPYLIGIGLAYMMTKYFEPNKKFMSKQLSAIGLVGITFTLFAVIAFSGILDLREYNAMEAAIFAGISRPIWALAICFLIIICVYGDAPFVSSFLGSSFMVPFNKLSYGLYLIHIFVICKKVFNTRNAIQFDFFNILVDAFGITVISYGVSLVTWLLFEAPMNNFVAVILRVKTQGLMVKIEKYSGVCMIVGTPDHRAVMSPVKNQTKDEVSNKKQ